MSFFPDYEVYINSTLYKPLKFDYDRPHRSIGTTPTCNITLDNQLGTLNNIISFGNEVEIYRNNNLRFVGVVDKIDLTSNDNGQEMRLTINNKWYRKLQNQLCDSYDFQEDVNDYGVTIDPWDINLFTATSPEVDGVSEFNGEPPVIDGFRFDEVAEFIAGTKFLSLHRFDTKDYLLNSYDVSSQQVTKDSLYDYSGNGNDLTINGSLSTITDAEAKWGDGYDGFSNSNYLKKTGMSIPFNTGTPHSVFIRFYWDGTTSGSETWFSLEDDFSEALLLHKSADSSIRLYGGGLGNYIIGNMVTGWNTLVLRRNNTALNWKLNGTTGSGTVASQTTQTVNEFYIGVNRTSASTWEQGAVSFRVTEVRLWMSSISDSLRDSLVDESDLTYQNTPEGTEEFCYFLESVDVTVTGPGLVVDESVNLQLPKTGVSGDSVSYATSVTTESIPLYNGDPNIDPMGDINSVDVTLWGQDSGTGSGTVALKVCRNGGTTNDVSGRDFLTVPLTKSTVTVQASPLVEIDKWTGSIASTGWGATATGNSLAYELTLTDDGTDSPRIEAVKLTASTDSDLGLERGTIETYSGNVLLDGSDYFEGALIGKRRIRALEEVQTGTIKVYDEGSPVEDDRLSTFWDIWIDDQGRFHFRKNKGSEINETYSFNNKSFGSIQKSSDATDLWWKVVAYGAGSGALRTRIVSDEEFSAGGLKIQTVKTVNGDSAKIGIFEDKTARSTRQLYLRARSELKLKSNPVSAITLPSGLFSEAIQLYDTGDLLYIESEDVDIDGYIGIHSINVVVDPSNGEDIRVTIGEPLTTLVDVLRDLNSSDTSSAAVAQDRIVRVNTATEELAIDTTNYALLTFRVDDPLNVEAVLLNMFSDANGAGDYPFNVEVWVDPDTNPPTSPADDDKLLPGKYGVPNTSVDLGTVNISNYLTKATNGLTTTGIHRVLLKSSGGSTSYNGHGLIHATVDIIKKDV